MLRVGVGLLRVGELRLLCRIVVLEHLASTR